MRIYPSHALVNKDNRIKEPKRIENEIARKEKNMCDLCNIMSTIISRQSRATTEHNYRAEIENKEMRIRIFITRTHEYIA
jgi:hypothetical protein